MTPRMGLDKQTILLAAIEIADKHGLEAVTLANVAKKLTVRSPSLYNHIEGLAGLRKELALHGLNELYNDLAKVKGEKSKEDAIHTFADSYIAFVRSHPGLYELTLIAPNPKDTAIQVASKKIVDQTLNLLKDYNLEEETALHVVRGIRSILHGFASLEQKGGFGLPLDLDKSIHLVIDHFLAGMENVKDKEK